MCITSVHVCVPTNVADADACAPLRVLTNPWDRFGKMCFEESKEPHVTDKVLRPLTTSASVPSGFRKAGHSSFRWGGAKGVYYPRQQTIFVSTHHASSPLYYLYGRLCADEADIPPLLLKWFEKILFVVYCNINRLGRGGGEAIN